MTKHTDGDLPAALRRLNNAITALTEPTTNYTNNHPHQTPSPYTQLTHATPGQQNGTDRHTPPQSIPPVWIDAIDLKHEIDTAIAAWQPQHGGPPTTITRLHQLANRKWRPQDTRAITQITGNITAWTQQIHNLLNPTHTKHVSAPCPNCGAETTLRRDSAGELVRAPALQIVAEHGCTCQACRTTWTPDRYLFLCKMLGFALPEGIDTPTNPQCCDQHKHLTHSNVR